MDVLVDTNVLVRRINRHDAQHRDARSALERIAERGGRACVAPQNMIEFWNVATRRAEKNGLGLTPAHADRIVRRFEQSFHMLADRAEIYEEWRRRVLTYAVSGLKVFDARLVAVSMVHRVKNIVTFNVGDFLPLVRSRCFTRHRRVCNR